MTLVDLSSRARENMLAAYLAIGRTFPGAEIFETDAYVALVSDLPHPSGNFAARLSLDPWSAAELRSLATTRPAFRAVALSDDGPPHLAELMRRAGFEVMQRLVSMAVTPQSYASPIDLILCMEAEQRTQVGRFVADTFFGREPSHIRDSMTAAIAEAESLSVYALWNRDRPIGAVTLSRSAGVLGIYNLSVARARQGEGLGSSIVEWCLSQAALEGRPACLQCLPSLEPWYSSHGFKRTGSISVWSLQNPLS